MPPPPKHPVFNSVLEYADIPLAAPSANPFGYLSPTRAEHVRETLGDKVDLIVDGGHCEFGLESTIVDITNPESFKILRPGPISAQEITSTLGIPTAYNLQKYSNPDLPQASPGLLKKHYSPTTPLRLFDSELPDFQLDKKIALVQLSRPEAPLTLPINVTLFWLSESGLLPEVAKNVFALLQQLDKQHFDLIYVQKAINDGLGIAINDRLDRASAQE